MLPWHNATLALSLSTMLIITIIACVLSVLALLFSYLSYSSLATRWRALESIVLFGDAAVDNQTIPVKRAEAREKLLQLALAFSRSRDPRINNPIIARLLESEAVQVGGYAETKGDLKGSERREWLRQIRHQAQLMRPPAANQQRV